MKTDFLIIGAGILGLTISLELKKRFPDQKIIIIEKESQVGMHASGRNSGVLHAGFYYTADSLKARFCRDGNRAMKAYCREHNIPLNENGKLVVVKDESELTALKTLYERGLKNGVDLKWIDEDAVREIEPRAKTIKHAIFSPETASVNPQLVLQSLIQEAQKNQITILYNEKYISSNKKEKIITTSKQNIHAGFVINTAGLYADHIAKQFGFSKHYEIVPFKGLYLYSDEKPGSLKTHIYPVPDLNYPFLGVHYTVTADGKIKLGPTAIPAFWRENYDGLKHFSASEMAAIVKREIILFLQNKFHFRKIALYEMKKYSKKFLASQASYMVHDFDVSQYKTWGKPGIRAQLVDTRDNTLVNDFCFEHDDYSLHVLNAVSPAFTGSFPFAKYLVEAVLQKRAR